MTRYPLLGDILKSKHGDNKTLTDIDTDGRLVAMCYRATSPPGITSPSMMVPPSLAARFQSLMRQR